jgi:hypothetical protein
MKTRALLEINWEKPKFKEEINEYLKDKYSINFFKNKYNLTLENDKACILFLEHGNSRVMDRVVVSRALTENLIIVKKDFQARLKDNNYKRLYEEMYEKLIDDGKLTLTSPILVKFPNLYYGFAGNMKMNLAFNLDMPVCFWVVDYKEYIRSRPTKKKV